MIPRATYRLQLHKDFTFADAARQAGYLAALGISHVYASPILAARAGSLHGYDVIDHARLNPELGGEAGFRAMADAFRQQGLGLIVDIVPNHMAVGQADNGWWLDVLEKGRDSRFAKAFDIDWDAPSLEGKVLAPFLDGTPQANWEDGALKLLRENGKWAFAYYDHRFALRPADQGLGATPTAWADAQALLERQNFVLADWRQADSRINWRRFFDITELAALRMEEPEVFQATHAKIFDLYREGLIDGLRVDHVDGLTDPAAYCHALRQALEAIRPGAYVIVEKILAEGETLSADWPVDGTTGYDAMNDITALLHADDGGALEALWHRQSGRAELFEQEEIEGREQILAQRFPAQFDALHRAFARVLPDRNTESLRTDLRTALVGLRCYRGYQTGAADSPPLPAPLSKALAHAPYLQRVFEDRSGNPTIMDALRRFHQLSAPLAAKAVEDTAFYRYGRLLSRNDVGFDPRRTFLAPAEFHARVMARAADFPNAMLTTATHDHKRGEDARARLAVLSAQPDRWREFVIGIADPRAVHPADGYFLVQTLLGAWPDVIDPDFSERIAVWCRKYLREAKLRSSWQSPDEDYEKAFCGHAAKLIADADFCAAMKALVQALTPLAQANSLAQIALRYALPGVPDLYQGCEFEDFSLVDPDNRRPVDYVARAALLAQAEDGQPSLAARKQKLIAALLKARRDAPLLWEKGSYIPIDAPAGAIAFLRRHGAVEALIAIRCNSTNPQGCITLPFAGQDLLTAKHFGDGATDCAELFRQWPAAILLRGN